MSNEPIDASTDGSTYEQTREMLVESLAEYNTAIKPKDLVFDVYNHRLAYVSHIVAGDLVEYYMSLSDAEQTEEWANLLTYSEHPYLPISVDDTVYGLVYLDDSIQKATNGGRTYPTPRGRIMRYPVEQSFREAALRQHGYEDSAEANR